jgi:hypothetical protein
MILHPCVLIGTRKSSGSRSRLEAADCETKKRERKCFYLSVFLHFLYAFLFPRVARLFISLRQPCFLSNLVNDFCFPSSIYSPSSPVAFCLSLCFITRLSLSCHLLFSSLYFLVLLFVTFQRVYFFISCVLPLNVFL